MSDDLTGTHVIAWSLYKPAYQSGGGRSMKHRTCYVMTVDNYLLTGFSAGSNDPRWRVFRYVTATAARRAAVSVTQSKENDGFVLSNEPRTAQATGGKREKLEALVGKNEPHADTLASANYVLTKGTLLSDAAA